MANDRLVLVDRKTKRAIVLASWVPSAPWEPCAADKIKDFLEEVAAREDYGDLVLVRESAGGWRWLTNSPSPLTVEIDS